jgi:diguanylate cyclase
VRYVETVARSAELLRQAIPLMSQQAAALHPVSYAVWYEYVAKSNPPLLKMVDDSLAKLGRLDEAKTYAIYRQYISEPLIPLPERVADGFDRLLSEMSDSANRAEAHTERYFQALEHLRGSLPATAVGPVAEVLEHTAVMAKAVDHLRAELAASQREICDLRAEVRRVRNDSLVDALTGLANRRSFDERLATFFLDASISSSASCPLCLVLVDIDHFKRINDTYGHAFGDEVLRAVARTLSGVVGDHGVVARIGGEEFAMLLPAMNVPQAKELAERARFAIASSRIRRSDGATLEHVTASLGVAGALSSQSPATLLESADSALYRSKQDGRDRVSVAESRP